MDIVIIIPTQAPKIRNSLGDNLPLVGSLSPYIYSSIPSSGLLSPQPRCLSSSSHSIHSPIASFKIQPATTPAGTTPTKTSAVSMGLFNNRFVNSQYKGKVHIAQVVIIAMIFALATGKIITRPSYIPMNRLDMVGMSMVSDVGGSQKFSGQFN